MQRAPWSIAVTAPVLSAVARADEEVHRHPRNPSRTPRFRTGKVDMGWKILSASDWNAE